MARPLKDNANWFKHDKNLRNSTEVRALRKNLGSSGCLGFYFFLETLTDSPSYEIELTPIRKELLAADYDLSVKEFEKMISYCLKIGLLSIKSKNLIYCPFLSFSLKPLDTKREQDRARINATKKNKEKDFDSETDIQDDYRGENYSYRGENSQKRKEKKRTEQNKSSISPACTREDDDKVAQDAGSTLSPVEKFRAESKAPVFTSEGLTLIISDRHYLLRLQADLPMELSDIVAWASQFRLRWKEQHQNMDDLCRRFENTLRKKIEANEAPPVKEAITNQRQAKQAWLRISALLALRKPELEDVLGSLSFHRFQNDIIQLVAATEEEARNAKTLLPLLEELSLEVSSSKIMFSFGVKNSKI